MKSLIYFCMLISIIVCEESTFLKASLKIENQASPAAVSEGREPKVHRGVCFIKIKNQFYDLNPLNQIIPWKMIDKKGNKIRFNLCSNIPTKCSKDDALIADPKLCRKFAGKAAQEKTWRLEKDKKSHKNILILNLPEGDRCKKGSRENYKTTLQITCTKKETFKILNEKEFDSNQCENVIKIESKYGKDINFL